MENDLEILALAHWTASTRVHSLEYGLDWMHRRSEIGEWRLRNMVGGSAGREIPTLNRPSPGGKIGGNPVGAMGE